jgi:hypothetical protein
MGAQLDVGLCFQRYGKKDVELLAGEMMDIFNKLDVLCNKQVKNSKVLEKWVVDM